MFLSRIFPHFPLRNSTASFPNVLVCGDGAENLTNFEFAGALSWKIGFQKFYGSTIGDAAFGDFNGDGFTDVIVSDYDSGYLRVFTYG